jgi:hypothetical protein
MRELSAISYQLSAGRVPLVLALALLLGADRVAADQGQPVFVVRTAEGKQLEGPLRGLAKDWAVKLGGGEDTTVPGADLVSVRRAGLALPPPPTGEHLVLANGDRVPVRGPRLVGERLHFTCPELDGGKETSVPLTSVSFLWRAAPDGADDPEALRRRLAAGSRPRDVVLLRNGDAVSGALSALDDERAVVEAEGRPVPVTLAQVAAVALSTELADPPRLRRVGARLVLADGSRLTLASASCDGGTLEARTSWGARVRVPLGRVAALDVSGGRAVYLSDLKEAGYTFTPFLDESWPLARDGNAAGHDLRLGGSSHDKGLGLHSRCRVRYRLGGAFRRFEALVGLDDRDGKRGSARVRVLADGKPLELPGSGELTHGSAPLTVGLDVASVRELTLEVDFGPGGNVQGVVDWADARLLR